MSAKDEILTAKTKAADRKIVREFFRRIPAMQRLASWKAEWVWYATQTQDLSPHKKCLPEYCYNIFEKFGRTYLKAFPKISDTITGDIKGLAFCKTIEDVKKIVKIDWMRLGTMIGIGIRGIRYVEMEAEDALKREGLLGLVPENGALDMALIFNQSRLEKMSKDCEAQDIGRGLEQILKKDTLPFIEKLPDLIASFALLANLWSSDALADFNKGTAIGLKGFLDADGQPVGESNRANIYSFLLLAWPEIKLMLGSNPKKTVTDLHTWMLPFMRHGITSLVDVETLRDVCGPMPGGIGLKLRPLSSRSD